MKIEEALSYEGMRYVKANVFKKSRVNQQIDLEHTVKEMLIRAPYLLSDVIYFSGGTSLDPAPAFVMRKVNQSVDVYQDAPGIGITQRWLVRGTRPLTKDEQKGIGIDDNNHYDWTGQLTSLLAVSNTLSSPFDFCKFVDVEIAVMQGTMVKRVNNSRVTGTYRYQSLVDWRGLSVSNGYTEKTRNAVSYGDYAMILNNRGAQQITMYDHEIMETPFFERGVDSLLFKHRVQNGLRKKEKVWSGWIPDRYYESKVVRKLKLGDNPTGTTEIRKLKGIQHTLPVKRTKAKDHFVGFILVIPSESNLFIYDKTVTLEAGEYMFDFDVDGKKITDATQDSYADALRILQRSMIIKPVVSRLNSLTKIGDDVSHSEHSIKTRPIQKAEEADAQPAAYNRVNTKRLG
jgi:hypothetical protein